jgi:catechol 2,3-dioxygenase-like lactoylglutathione lyase family enzyme
MRPGSVGGFDHISLPMRHTDAMVAFYRSLGLDVAEQPHVVSVYVGDQMINFHRPATWKREGFTLRAPAAEPPCGDICLVWEGSPESLEALLDATGAAIVEGPVIRHGGRRADGTSRYVRDPDGNLVEFIVYGTSGVSIPPNQSVDRQAEEH